MNKHTYRNQIIRLRNCIETINDVVTELGDDADGMDNSGDIESSASDRAYLSIAVELIGKTLPTV